MGTERIITVGPLRPVSAMLGHANAADERPTVAVVIPTFNHAQYLGDAIRSVLAQTRQADQIIVVDDGSTDDPASVVADFRGVRLIRQDNRGLSAARNTGLRNCTTSHVIFLDADDRLLPNALDAGLRCIAERPDCAFVYGGHRLISEQGQPIAPDSFNLIKADAHLALLRGNRIVSIATVLFRRDYLLALKGFDETLRRCEDYDVYLRLTERYPISCHPTVVAEYRKHSTNMSNDNIKQLNAVLHVLDQHERRISADARTRRALREGRANMILDAALDHWRAHRNFVVLLRDLSKSARWSWYRTARVMLAAFGRRTIRERAIRSLPRPLGRFIQRIRSRPYRIPTGAIRFGDLRRQSPISNNFGFDRGTPIDRFYIEGFLAKYSGDIKGHVLETDDAAPYAARLGKDEVEQIDILSIGPNSPRATIVGDLAHAASLPESKFDCIVLTQTLQFAFDVRSALATLHRALKPGGVLLLTVPGLSKVMHDRWPWYWTFTTAAIRRLLEDQFGEDAASIEVYGNVLAVTAFIQGVAAEELDQAELVGGDPSFPVVVAARAVKQMP